MSWKTEHATDYEVPGIIDFMVKKGILKDISWHNDTMPRFVIEHPDDDSKGVTIWVDHPIGTQRETGAGGKRFLVQHGDLMSDSEYDLETDDLETALQTALAYAQPYFKKQKYIPDYEGIVREWMKPHRR